MSEIRGTVVAIDSNGRNVLVDVSAERCARCAAGKGCGAGLVGTAASGRGLSVRLPSGQRLAVGDTVQLALSSRSVLVAAGIVYGYPLAAAVMGVLLAYGGSFGDPVASLFGLTGVLVGMALARFRLRQSAYRRRFEPTVRLHAEPSIV